MPIGQLTIRLLLIASLALWSPAWCCCALWASMSDGHLSATCTARASSVDRSVSASPAGTLRPCCQQRLSLPAPVDSPCDERESECQCQDRPDELMRLDTATKVSSPFSHPAPAADHIIDPTTSAPRLMLARLFSEISAHGPPRTTLFAQHCLLLI